MATILRTWSYQYQWLYDSISFVASLGLGGEKQFRNLSLQGLEINQDTKILDLCCGAGQTTQFLCQYSQEVTGLDISPVALERAKKRAPGAKYVEGLAQKIPISEHQFDLVHTSVAMHEMTFEALQQIFAEVYRVLKPGGIFTIIDFHKPTNQLFWPSLALFLWLFETETSWQFLQTDLLANLQLVGFGPYQHQLYLGGSLQVIQVKK